MVVCRVRQQTLRPLLHQLSHRISQTCKRKESGSRHNNQSDTIKRSSPNTITNGDHSGHIQFDCTYNANNTFTKYKPNRNMIDLGNTTVYHPMCVSSLVLCFVTQSR